MKVVSPMLTLLVAIVASGTLAAQEVRAILVERIQELNLTDEQEAKIAEIQKAARPKVEAAAKGLAALPQKWEIVICGHRSSISSQTARGTHIAAPSP